MKQPDTAILSGNKPIGPFPMHRIKRVDKPTTFITDDVKRIDRRQMAFAKAPRGEYGPAIQKEMLRWFRRAKEPTYAAIAKFLTYCGAYDQSEINSAKAPIPEDPAILSRHIKSLGYFMKADVMGICRLPQAAIYSHDLQGNPIRSDLYQFAIVIVSSKDYPTIKASSGHDWIVNSLSFQSYLQSAIIAHSIANYIRGLGYAASAEHGIDRYQVLIPPLLLWAGIGEVSRCGIILNPFLGMDYKGAAVLTNLPLLPDKPVDFGLQDFCQNCKICAEACPAGAIPKGDKVMYNGYMTWKLDEQRCASYFIGNQKGIGCISCTKACPWTRPHTWPHNFTRWTVRNSSLARRLATSVDKNRSHIRANGKEKWWFDLEDTDGVWSIPPAD
jgi:ferredoxin